MQNFGRGMWRRVADYEKIQKPLSLLQFRHQQKLKPKLILHPIVEEEPIIYVEPVEERYITSVEPVEEMSITSVEPIKESPITSVEPVANHITSVEPVTDPIISVEPVVVSKKSKRKKSKK